jgi:hypothetical protein
MDGCSGVGVLGAHLVTMDLNACILYQLGQSWEVVRLSGSRLPAQGLVTSGVGPLT